jgi:lysophospholipase L1-like esterase
MTRVLPTLLALSLVSPALAHSGNVVRGAVPPARSKGVEAQVASKIDVACIVKRGGRIALYGDSRSSTDYSFNETAMASVFGGEVMRKGRSGHTATQNATDADLAVIFDLAPSPQIITFFPGGNDAGSPNTVGTFSPTSSNGVEGEPVVGETDITQDYAGTYFVQAISHAVRKIRAHYNGRTQAGLVGSRSQLPILVLLTDMPQQREGPTNAFSLSANWQRKRQAILEVAAKYDVVVVDTMKDIKLDMAKEPFWVPPTDKIANNGVFYMDGLHPNATGWKRIAELIHMRLAQRYKARKCSRD